MLKRRENKIKNKDIASEYHFKKNHKSSHLSSFSKIATMPTIGPRIFAVLFIDIF